MYSDMLLIKSVKPSKYGWPTPSPYNYFLNIGVSK